MSNRSLTFVLPLINHSNSSTIIRNGSFFVVNIGNPLDKSKRICAPNSERVPVPVRSPLRLPSFRTFAANSKYWGSTLLLIVICIFSSN
ncbi:hypothetical protein BC01_024 [Bacillus phage BC01]|nr:hypothetical protein BC01_024 [Bacillus phage BC01]